MTSDDISLRVISRFLEDFEPEVQARSATAVTPPLEEKIGRLVRGELPEGERQVLCHDVLRNREAMKLLVEMLKGS
ncbi:MAG: hypothetical protein AAF591_12090 [Verrucomicrobiota bacterium]